MTCLKTIRRYCSRSTSIKWQLLRQADDPDGHHLDRSLNVDEYNIQFHGVAISDGRKWASFDMESIFYHHLWPSHDGSVYYIHQHQVLSNIERAVQMMPIRTISWSKASCRPDSFTSTHSKL